MKTIYQSARKNDDIYQKERLIFIKSASDKPKLWKIIGFIALWFAFIWLLMAL